MIEPTHETASGWWILLLKIMLELKHEFVIVAGGNYTDFSKQNQDLACVSNMV